MPVFNGEKYLKEAISSILEQTYPFFELLIVDDGSTDDSLKIILEFSRLDKRIKPFESAHIGVSGARNLGLSNSNNDYVLFVDCDDFWNNNLLEKCNYYLANGVDYILFGSVSHFLDSNLNITKLKQDFAFESTDSSSVSISDVNQLFFEQYNIYAVWNKVFNRNVIVKYNIKFNENCVALEDFIFNLDYMQHVSNIIIVHYNLYNYRLSTETNKLYLKRIFKTPFLNSDILFSSIDSFKNINSKFNICLLDDIAFNLYKLEFKSLASLVEKRSLVKLLNSNPSFSKLLDERKGKKAFLIRVFRKLKMLNLEAKLLLQ